MEIAYFVGFINALFFIFLILTRKQLRKSDFLLSFFLSIIGLKLLFIYASETNFYEQYPKIIFIEVFYWTLLGPLLFLYIEFLSAKVQKFRLIHLLHLLPSVIAFAGISEYFFSNQYKSLFEFKSDTLFFKVSQYVWLFNTHIYYVFCLIKLRKHQLKIKEYFSYRQKIDLKWLNFLTYGFALFLFYMLVYLLLRKFLKVEIPFINSTINWFIMVVYVFGIGFYGFKQQGIFNNIYENHSHKPGQRFPLYEKSGLSEDEKVKILEQLTAFMSEEKPYLDPELNIRQLAELLEVQVHKLSQTINQNLQKTFFDFVNEYRVKEATNCLKNKEFEKYSILAIAYDCGFNSKTSFYNVFKKYTSKTPTQYRESYSNLN